MNVFEHEDQLAGLESSSSLLEKLQTIHTSLRHRHPGIGRVAVAIYDDDTDALRTLISSNDGDNPLQRYECKLADAPSLEMVFRERKPRLVQDLALFERGVHTHTKKIAGEGFRSSYTIPVFQSDRFIGFVFFNSRTIEAFSRDLVDELDVWAHLIGSLVAHEVTASKMLVGAIKTASDLVHAHDPETYEHLQRMARYARLIAVQLTETGRCSLTDEEIERIFWFAPMHDLGKIGIPDAVLTKPARLDAEELDVMRQHTEMGATMLDRLVANFDLRSIHGIQALREVALMHHEALDGSGYPEGLTGDEIPLVARIVAVADIFDALTSPRPYKRAWSIDEAFETLRQMAERKLDRNCVDALVEREEDVRRIQERFR